VYLDVQLKIEAEQARDTSPVTMQRFLPFKEDLRRNLRSVGRGREDSTWGLPSTETGKAPLTANHIKALEKEVANLRTPSHILKKCSRWPWCTSWSRWTVVADAVVHEVVHVVMLEGVAVAYAVLQAVTSRNHDSMLFVVLPSILLKNAHMLTLQLSPVSRSAVKTQGHGTRTDNYGLLRGN
jgi:hypothetical protein